MKKTIITIIAILLAGGLSFAGLYYWKQLQGIWPTIAEPTKPIKEVINTTDMPLTLPPGFSIEIFAGNVPEARVMAMDGMGNMWVSQRGEGTITLLEIEGGKVISQSAIFRNLNNPHGLAIDPQNPLLLYVAEEDKISRVPLYSDAPLEKIVNLPSGGRHFTRTIGFGPDDRLYVSIGSTCDVCEEPNPKHAAIHSLNRDGSDFKEFARGLRNSVFFTWSFVDGRMWATEMGRDGLGDDLPPDEINIIGEGKNYGWPICYGKNIHDTEFDTNTYIRNPCMEPFEISSHIDIPAHSSPLGLAFIPEEGWPEEYWYNLLVAYHGSWNRSEPTGYKLVRFKLDEKGNYLGEEDFIYGWLQEKGGALGRPVDILIQPGGIMYVSDDKAGVIYRVTYQGA